MQWGQAHYTSAHRALQQQIKQSGGHVGRISHSFHAKLTRVAVLADAETCVVPGCFNPTACTFTTLDWHEWDLLFEHILCLPDTWLCSGLLMAVQVRMACIGVTMIRQRVQVDFACLEFKEQ